MKIIVILHSKLFNHQMDMEYVIINHDQYGVNILGGLRMATILSWLDMFLLVEHVHYNRDSLGMCDYLRSFFWICWTSLSVWVQTHRLF